MCLFSTSKYLSIAIWTVYFFSFLLDSHWGTLIEFCFSGSFDDAFIHFFFFIQWFPTFFFCGGEGGSLPQTAPLKSTEDPPTFVSFFIYYFPRANNVDIATSSFPEKKTFWKRFLFLLKSVLPPPRRVHINLGGNLPPRLGNTDFIGCCLLFRRDPRDIGRVVVPATGSI